MREFFDLANNPLFVKHVRSRLRRAAVLPGLVVIAFLCLCIIWIDSEARKGPGADPAVGSQIIFWLQGLILVLMGGSQVASAVAHIKDTGIIDFHRVTPVPSHVQTIGLLLGAPIRELVFYAVTLPFAVYLAMVGPIGITNFCKLFLVQLGTALMYYSLAMVTGLSARTAKGASGRFVAFIAGLNLMANIFFQFGVYGPTLVTSIPVYREVFVDGEDSPEQKRRKERMQRIQQQQQQFLPQPPPGLNAQQRQQWILQQQQQQRMQQRQFGGQDDEDERRPKVTFYSAPIPLVVQSMMFQAAIWGFFFIAASRRVRSARLPLFTKPIALTFLSVLAFLTLGSLWDAPELFLTLGCVYFLTFCGIMLIGSITPPLGEVVKGIQRARKLSGYRVPVWSDHATNKLVALGFAGIILATMAIGLSLAPKPPILGFINLKHAFTPWPAVGVGVLTLLSYAFALQHFGMSMGKRASGFFGLFIFFAWIVPIALGAIIAASGTDNGAYVMAMSPIIGISFAGMFGVPLIDKDVIRIVSLAPGAIFTAMFFVLLLNQERKLHNEVVEEHDTRRSRRGAAEQERES